MAENTERTRALETALSQIEKNFGKGAIKKLNNKPAVSVENIPTGALALDESSDRCGIPRGRNIEV